MNIGQDLIQAAQYGSAPKGTPIANSLAQKSSATTQTQTSYDNNKHKPCAKCDQPRHISRAGNCHTTLCTEHYLADQAKHRRKFRSSFGA